MSSTRTKADPRLLRAHQHRDRIEAAVCDEVRTWEHGTILRAHRYPMYYSYNFVRIAGEPGLAAPDLANVADEALDGLEHRRLEFDRGDAGEAVRAELDAAGWRSMRAILMRFEPSDGAASALDVELEELPYDEVRHLRERWHLEDFDMPQSGMFRAAEKEVAMRHDARVFGVRGDRGVPVAFAQLEVAGSAAEITQVYVQPGDRGRGLGTRITSAAARAAGEVEDLWIRADDEGRPKELYRRLGFRPLWATMEFLLLP
ncbi:MAG: GNAT family N-acetyltransferase [Solirubrobacteraceae bacterium]